MKNKEMLNKVYRVAEPMLFFIFGSVLIRVTLSASWFESMLYSLIAIGGLEVFVSCSSLIVGAIKMTIAKRKNKKVYAKLTTDKTVVAEDIDVESEEL